jgi:hypothetical protein
VFSDKGSCGWNIGNPAIGCSRDIVAGTEILHETLGTLHFSCSRTWSERFYAEIRQLISESCDERGFGANDDKLDFIVLRESDDPVDVLSGYGDAFGFLRNSGIAWRAIELGNQRGTRNSPAQRMFTAAAAYYQDPHCVILPCTFHLARYAAGMLLPV